MKEHGWSENYDYNTDDFLLYPVSESLISL